MTRKSSASQRGKFLALDVGALQAQPNFVQALLVFRCQGPSVGLIHSAEPINAFNKIAIALNCSASVLSGDSVAPSQRKL